MYGRQGPVEYRTVKCPLPPLQILAMAICGPKLSLCGVVLSIWGIVQLSIMGVFFYINRY